MRVRHAEGAAEEIAAILDYRHRQSPDGARSVALALRRTVRLIQSFPNCGERTDVRDVREVSRARHPYKIYDALGPGAVWIVHLRDARCRARSDEDTGSALQP